MEGGGVKGDGVEEFKGLRITSLDEKSDEEEEELKEQEIVVDNNDEEDDEEDEEAREYLVLGFVKRPKKASSLLRHYFPSKAGGVPAWLDPENLPSGKSCLCDLCGDPLQFMLQLYAPEEKPSAFHRTLFVFMCTSMACLRRDQHEQWKSYRENPLRSVKVFRCQLPRDNPFYPSDPSQKGTDPPEAKAALCNWCGTWKGIKRCSCKQTLYCSQKHAVMHSRSGHESDCQRVRISSQLVEGSSTSVVNPPKVQKVASKGLWPEYKILQEYESSDDTETPHNNVNTNSLVSRNQIDDGLMSIADSFEGDDDKKSWASFQEQISLDPEQVLRYCRSSGAKPLWPMTSGRPSKAHIPKCQYCDGPLCFEFQILPQLLYYFHVKNDPDSLDWATIVVYTCEAFCDASVAYKEEFAWVQIS